MTNFKGTREAFAAAMMDLAEERNDIMVISPDSLKAMRAVPFGEKYPDHYVECGIAEQCAVDVAAGLASAGLTPFVGTYCGFLTMRACEQMRTFVGYTDLNVKFVGVNAGLLGGEREGVTHQFYEDLAIVSAFPNYTIFTPADPAQCYHAVKLAADIKGPVYIRAGSGREVDVYDKNAPFAKSGITVWKDYGSDAVLFSNGFVLDRVLAVADLFKEQGIDAVIMPAAIDNPFISHVEQKKEGLKFLRIDTDLNAAFKEEVKEDDEDFKKSSEELTEVFKKALNNDKLDIKVEKMKTAGVAAMITVSEETRRMQDMMKMYSMGGGMNMDMFGGAGETLVLNANHPLVQYVLGHKEGENTSLICEQLYDLASLSHGQLSPERMTKFVSRSNEIMLLMAGEKKE